MNLKEKMKKYEELKLDLQKHTKKHLYWLRVKKHAEKGDTAIYGRNSELGDHEYLEPCIKEVIIEECNKQLRENKEVRESLENK